MLAIGKVVLLPTVLIAAPLVSIFTRSESYKLEYKWGWLFGTYDNPPQGDNGWVTKRSLYPNITTGFKGYVNRVLWMIRNPLYGYNKLSSIKWKIGDSKKSYGNADVSDKYKVGGVLLTTLIDYKDNPKAFGLYLVLPYTKKRCLRVRLGWKVKSNKVEEYGFAQLVVTINPFDGFG